MKGKQITPAQREQVRVFYIAGMKHKAIAKQVGLAQGTVARTLQRLGLAPKNPEPTREEIERNILRLHRAGFGSPRIAKKLDVALHRVIEVLQVHALVPPPGKPGCRYAVPEKIKIRIRREYRNFERTVAKKYNLSDVWTRRFLRGGRK